jgi:hypothetical protein
MELAAITRWVNRKIHRTIHLSKGEEAMNGEEILQAAVRCEKTDRVLVAPMILFYTARHGGMTMECFVHDQRKAFEAFKWTFNDHGGWDMLYAPCGYDLLVYSLEVPVRLRIPGGELPPNEI